jgi:hypothetical protein
MADAVTAYKPGTANALKRLDHPHVKEATAFPVSAVRPAVVS